MDDIAEFEPFAAWELQLIPDEERRGESGGGEQ